MKEEVVEKEVALAMDGLNVKPEDRELVWQLGCSYRKGDLDWFFQQLVEARGCGAELKHELRLFHDRLRRDRQGMMAKRTTQVALTKPELPGSEKFNDVVDRFGGREEAYSTYLKQGGFERDLEAQRPRRDEDAEDMVVAPWQRTGE